MQKKKKIIFYIILLIKDKMVEQIFSNEDILN